MFDGCKLTKPRFQQRASSTLRDCCRLSIGALISSLKCEAIQQTSRLRFINTVIKDTANAMDRDYVHTCTVCIEEAYVQGLRKTSSALSLAAALPPDKCDCSLGLSKDCYNSIGLTNNSKLHSVCCYCPKSNPGTTEIAFMTIASR